jgi:hypothetical protein
MRPSLIPATDTGSAAVATTIAPNKPFKWIDFRIHLSAAGGAGDLTITLDSANGALYDCVFKTQDMTAVTSFHYRPADGPIYMLNPTDKILIAWANANTRDWGLEFIYELL